MQDRQRRAYARAADKLSRRRLIYGQNAPAENSAGAFFDHDATKFAIKYGAFPPACNGNFAFDFIHIRIYVSILDFFG